MKRLAVMILVAFNLPLSAQELSSVPMKGANRLVIKNTKSQADNFSSLMPFLIDQGFMVDKKDDAYYLLQTQPMTIKGTAVNIQASFIAKDSAIVISGVFTPLLSLTFGVSSAGTQYRQIENIGIKGSDYRDAFNSLVKLASKIPGALMYQRK